MNNRQFISSLRSTYSVSSRWSYYHVPRHFCNQEDIIFTYAAPMWVLVCVKNSFPLRSSIVCNILQGFAHKKVLIDRPIFINDHKVINTIYQQFIHG